MTEKNDGGPAYPVPMVTTETCGVYRDVDVRWLSMRDVFAMNAPADIVQEISGCTHSQIAEFLDLPIDKIQWSIHHPIADTKARYIYADMMLEARKQ